MQLLIRNVTHSRFPLGYRVTLETKSGIFTAVRTEDGVDSLAFYTDKAVAVRDQSQWYNDQCITRERAAKAAANPIDRLVNNLAAKGLLHADEIDAYIDAGGHLSSDPAKCGCGDCLTYMAGE